MDDCEGLIRMFNEAFNRHEVAGMMALMSDDCVFENTFPPPEGERVVGKTAVGAFWQRFFQQSPHAHIEIEELFVAGERAVQRWVYHWRDARNEHGYVRGVDVFRCREGKIVEKLSYVKG